MQTDNKNKPRDEDDRHEYIPGAQEKTTIGGDFNSGVTSNDPDEKNEIEKQGSLAKLKEKNREAADGKSREAE